MKPIQYQKGYVEFYKLKFKVTPDVLIPRPETELLVDEVLTLSRTHLNQGRTLTILDIGTGTGNIAISIARNLSVHPSVHPRGVNINIIATDISQKTLKVAKQNAKLHGVKNKIKFVKSNLLSTFRHPEHFDFAQCKLCKGSSTTMKDLSRAKSRDSSLITRNDNLVVVTNLPYIPSARIPYLDASVKDFEPQVALDGGKDGFELYRKLFQQISRLSTPGTDSNLHSRSVVSKPKLIICEIDYTHGELAINEAYKYFPDAKIEVKLDLSRKQRILIIKNITD